MSVKCVVLTCEKYHNSRVVAIDNTWGKEIDVIYLSDLTIEDKFIGYPELPKGYENIYHKYIKFFKEYNFTEDWYFFCDDDTYVNVDKLKTLINNNNNNNNNSPICIGIVGTLNADATDKYGNFTGFPLHTITGDSSYLPIRYPSGGAGFLLNLSAIRCIKNYFNMISDFDIPKCYNSDVTIGFWIRNSGIELLNVDGFWWANPEGLNHTDEQIKNSYTYHYVSESLMYELQNKIKNELYNHTS
jgi:hypothetical protein